MSSRVINVSGAVSAQRWSAEAQTEALSKLSKGRIGPALSSMERSLRQGAPAALETVVQARRLAETLAPVAHHLESLQVRFSKSWYARWCDLRDSIIEFVESVISAFGILSFFKQSTSEFEADGRGNKLYGLSIFFGLLSAMLIPLLGAGTAATATAVVFLSIQALSLLYPFIHPVPTRLPKGENLTRKVRSIPPRDIRGRQKMIGDIADALSRQRLPLLVGPSGVGKSSIVEALAEEASRGLHPQLANLEFFYFTTSTLVQHTDMLGGGNNILATIREKIGRHPKRVVLVFDEVQAAFYQDIQAKLFGQTLKTMLQGVGESSFPYVIAMTTSGEQRQHVAQDPALERRFVRIMLDPIDEHETRELLRRTLQRTEHLWLSIEGKTLRTLSEVAKQLYPDWVEPTSSTTLLDRCLQNIESRQIPSACDGEMERLQQKLQRRLSRQALYGPSAAPDQTSQKDAELQAKLAEAMARAQEHRRLLPDFLHHKRLLTEAKSELYRRASTIHKWGDKPLNPKQQREAALLLWMQEALLPALQRRLNELGARLNIPTAITEELIQQMAAQQRALMAPAQQVQELEPRPS